MSDYLDKFYKQIKDKKVVEPGSEVMKLFTK